jgi:putative peptidoglycan lipid II flippase
MRKLLDSKIFQSSLLLAVLFGIDKIVGLARQAFVSRTYDIGAQLDAYNAANNLPDTVVTLLAGGALAVALIPVLTEALDKNGRDGLWALFSRVMNIAFVLAAVSALVLAIFAEPFVQHVVVPNFSPEQQHLTAGLMRVNLIAMLIFTISGLATSGLQANQHFLTPGLAPILYNVGQIVGIFVLSPAMGIYGLAYGVILGAFMHLAIQIPALVRYGFRWAPSLDWRFPGVGRVAQVIGPRLLNIAAFQFIFIVTDRFASGLSEGSVSALAYGWLIMQMPQTVIGTSTATALLPALADLSALGDKAGLKRTLRRALGILLAITIPVTILAVLLIGPFLQFASNLGFFSANGAALILAASLAFLPGLVSHTLVEVGVRAFYAQQKPWVPLAAAVASAIAFTVLCTVLVSSLGHAGIALANTLAFTGQALILLAVLKWQDVI